MKSSKEIKKESIELIAKRPINFIIPDLLFVILATIASEISYDSNNAYVSSMLFLLIIFVNVGYCWFIISNRKRWHKKNMGSLESSIASYNYAPVWSTLGGIAVIGIIDLLFVLILSIAMLYAYTSTNDVSKIIYFCILIILIIFNVLLACFKYAFLDQFTIDTPLSNKKNRFANTSWNNKFLNAVIISIKLMTNEQFLWEWVKLTFTTILWLCFSTLLFQFPLIIVYPYTMLCYIKLYDEGIVYLRSSSSANEISDLSYKNTKKDKSVNKTSVKTFLRKCNDGSLIALLDDTRKLKQKIKGIFTGPTPEEEKKAEHILKEQNDSSQKTNKTKSDINKQGLKQVKQAKQQQSEIRAKMNRPSTNPKDKNNKVMRKDHGR